MKLRVITLAAAGMLIAGAAVAQQGTNPTPGSGAVTTPPSTSSNPNAGSSSGGGSGSAGNSVQGGQSDRERQGTDQQGAVRPYAGDQRPSDAIKPSGQ